MHSQKPAKDILAIIDGRHSTFKRVKTGNFNKKSKYIPTIDNSYYDHQQIDDFSANEEGIFLAEKSEISSLYEKPAPSKKNGISQYLKKRSGLFNFIKVGSKNVHSHKQSEKPQICESLGNRTSVESMRFVSGEYQYAEEENLLFDSEIILY
jgi:hypothetical protein